MKGFIERFKIPLAIVAGFVLLGLMVAGSQASVSSNQAQEEAEEPVQTREGEQQNLALVTFVVDGDTVEIASGERVRLIGIDTPERGDPYYLEAKQKLEEFVLQKQVRLEKDISETDRYGRLLRYVYVGNTFVNLQMARQGYATAYTYPPDVAHSGQFVAAAAEARDKQIGLWAPDQQEPMPPPPSPSSFSVPSCISSDCDCGDFSSHAYAQWFHDNHNPGDSHRLDADDDGLACESLP